MNNSPIGVFDSGAGGLSVFSRLIKLLPEENYIYFADNANLPYGSKTPEELIKLSRRIFDFFKSKKAKAVVMACNTTSAIVYDYFKSQYNFQIYPLVQSVSKYIAQNFYSKIGVFATEAVINAHAYKRFINEYNPDIKIYETACPEWVSIVENKMQHDTCSLENIKKILDAMLENRPEKIILGCTHYPFLLEVLSKYAPYDMFIDPACRFAQVIAEDLKSKNLLNKDRFSPPVFYTSGEPEKFKRASELFYKVSSAEQIMLAAC